MRKALYVLLIVFFITLSYTFLRYNVVRSVPFENFPLYILNKSVALTATIMIGLSFILGPLVRFWPKTFESSLALRKYLGLLGFGTASFHALMSLILYSPSYYPKFFLKSGKMNLIGESSMLFGILAFAVFAVIAITSLPSVEQSLNEASWKRIQRLGYLAYFFVLLHVFIMGFSGWFKPEGWQYGLASISLISALVIILVLLMRVIVAVFPRKNSF